MASCDDALIAIDPSDHSVKVLAHDPALKRTHGFCIAQDGFLYFGSGSHLMRCKLPRKTESPHATFAHPFHVASRCGSRQLGLWRLCSRGEHGNLQRGGQPLLKQRCFIHSHEKKIKGGLCVGLQDRLAKRRRKRRGAGAGQAGGRGLLIKAVSYVDKDLQMPPKKQLAPEEVAVLKEWIKQGAPDPRTAESVGRRRPAMPEADESADAPEGDLDWWSLKPLRRTQPPAVRDAAWSRDPAGPFRAAAALDAAGSAPAATAAPEVLLRRLSLVLTGLPPRPEQRERFPANCEHDGRGGLRDASGRCCRRCSPAFRRALRAALDGCGARHRHLRLRMGHPGEGFSGDRGTILIRAFNEDIGYDRLLREQLAGDLLPEPRINRETRPQRKPHRPDVLPLRRASARRQHVLQRHPPGHGKQRLMRSHKASRHHRGLRAMPQSQAEGSVSQRDYYALAAVFMTPRWTARNVDAPGKTTQLSGSSRNCAARFNGNSPANGKGARRVAAVGFARMGGRKSDDARNREARRDGLSARATARSNGVAGDGKHHRHGSLGRHEAHAGRTVPFSPAVPRRTRTLTRCVSPPCGPRQ